MGDIIICLMAAFWFCSIVWGSWSVTFYLTGNGPVSSLIAFFVGLLVVAVCGNYEEY